MIRRNYAYEEYLLKIGAAPGDIEALRAEWAEALRAEAAELGHPEPEPEPESGPTWLSNITPSMITRAGRRPAANTAHRAELLHGPSRSTSLSDRFGDHITTYGDFLDRGFKR